MDTAMIKILLLFLLSFNLYAYKCVRLSNQFIKSGKEIELLHFPETRLNHASIQAEYRSIDVGHLNYTIEDKNWYYIDLVKTKYNFLREGIQSTLIKTFIELNKPDKITLHFGETNKKIFLESAFDELFNHLAEPFYKAQLAEAHLIDNQWLGPSDKISRAAFNTPTGKALYRNGFNKVVVSLSTYPIAGHRNIRIFLIFTKEKK